MPTEPLTPQEVDRLLRPDWRTTSADLLMLRDSLLRMRDAFERLATTAERLRCSARMLEGMAARQSAHEGGALPRAPRE